MAGNQHHLDFERPIVELEKKISDMKDFSVGENIELATEIESMQANFSLESGVSFSLAGFFCASREKLKGLGADELKRFAEQDYLDLLYLHIYSLSNIDKLMERYAQAEADDTATLHS